MQKKITKFTSIGLVLLAITSSIAVKTAMADNPQVVVSTSQGEIIIELLPKFAPRHVQNFFNPNRGKFL
jgi:hypothetical protein